MRRALVDAVLLLTLASAGCSDPVGPGDSIPIQISGERLPTQPMSPNVTVSASAGAITIRGDYFAECDLVNDFEATANRRDAEITVRVRYDASPICSGVPSVLRYTAVVTDLAPGTYVVDVAHANDGYSLTPGARVTRTQVVVP